MKRENIFLVVVLIVAVIFVIFLPRLDNIISGRKVEVHEKNNQNETKQPTEYTCTSTSDSKLANVSKKTIFKLNQQGKVISIDTTTISAYNNKEEYKTNKKAANALKEEGITYKVSTDDINHVVTVQSIQEIAKNNNTPYPIEYKELNNYLAQNNYICSTK